MITDKDLLEYYMWGYRDGLNELISHTFRIRNNSLKHKAYYLGKDDAILANNSSKDIPVKDLQTNEQILNRIKQYSENELKQIFENKFDCYADTSDDSVVMAMSKERYVEVLKELMIIT